MFLGPPLADRTHADFVAFGCNQESVANPGHNMVYLVLVISRVRSSRCQDHLDQLITTDEIGRLNMKDRLQPLCFIYPEL